MRVRELAVSVRPEDEHPHGLIGGHKVTEQREAPLVGPLEVVEDEKNWLMLGDSGKESYSGGEEEEALGVAVGRLGGREVGDSTGECWNESGQFRSMGSQMNEELSLGGVNDVVPEGL